MSMVPRITIAVTTHSHESQARIVLVSNPTLPVGKRRRESCHIHSGYSFNVNKVPLRPQVE